MWIGEVLDVSDGILQRIYLKLGQKVKVGRSADNGICFPSDKSISRLHAELSIVSNSAIHVVDLGSSLGSFINNEKLQANQEYILHDDSIVKFGALNSRVRFVKKQLSFCVTRLDKAEKDRLKKNAKVIGGKVVQIADKATHLVANKFTATIKLLTAIVLNIKIVTSDWLISFTEKDSASEIVPREEDFLPIADETCAVTDLSISRIGLFENIVVLLLNEEDLQYNVIVVTCGATVVRLFDAEVTTQLIQSQVKKYSSNTKQVCIFFDESKGVSAPRHLIPEGSTVQWLTVEHLAKSVMSCVKPTLLLEPPVQLRISASQSQQIPQYTSQLSAGGGTPSQTPLNTQHSMTNAGTGWTQPSQIVEDVSPPSAAAVSVFSKLVGAAKSSSAQVVAPVATVQNEGDPVSIKTENKRALGRSNKRSFLDLELEDEDDVAEVKAATTIPAADLMSPVKKMRVETSRAMLPPVSPPTDTPAATVIQQQVAQSTHAVDSVDKAVAAANPVEPAAKKQRTSHKTVDESPAIQVQTIQNFFPRAVNKIANSLREQDDTAANITPEPVAAALKSVPVRGKKGIEVEVEVEESVTPPKTKSSKKDTVVTMTSAARQNAVVPEQEQYVFDSFNPVAHEDSGVIVDAQPDADNWFPILRGISRMTVMQSKQHAQEEHQQALIAQQKQRQKQSAHLQPSASNAVMRDFEHDNAVSAVRDDDDEYDVNAYTQPVVVERALLVRGRKLAQAIGTSAASATSSSSRSTASSAAVSSSSTSANGTNHVRNMKKFVKNFVRQVDVGDVMSSRSMDRVLPKESERELQLRLEAEAVKAREDYAEQMFSDRFNDGAAGRGKVRR